MQSADKKGSTAFFADLQSASSENVSLMRAWYWGLQIPEKSGRTFLTPDCKSGGTPSGLAARIQPTQPLHSANSATSFSQLSRFFQPTQPLLSANATTSFSQHSHFILPTQPLRSANAATSFCQRSHFILSNKVPHSSYEYAS